MDRNILLILVLAFLCGYCFNKMVNITKEDFGSCHGNDHSHKNSNQNDQNDLPDEPVGEACYDGDNYPLYCTQFKNSHEMDGYWMDNSIDHSNMEEPPNGTKQCIKHCN